MGHISFWCKQVMSNWGNLNDKEDKDVYINASKEVELELNAKKTVYTFISSHQTTAQNN
jgi:hypothetical protein